MSEFPPPVSSARDGFFHEQGRNSFCNGKPGARDYAGYCKGSSARVVGTGRSDFPNQVNNVLIFPGIFKGALEGRATAITEEMKLAAAAAIAGLVDDSDLNDENILPAAFDPRVADVVSRAVKEHIQ